MAKRAREYLRGRQLQDQNIRLNKTPAGVWLIVGMAAFFVVGGVGISAFILVKALEGNEKAPALSGLPTGDATPVGGLQAGTGSEDAGVDSPNPAPAPGSTVSPLPLVTSNPDEEERTRREVLVRIDLTRSLTNDEKDKLYAQVERAQGFKKIAIIPFAEKSTIVAATQIDALTKNLREPFLQKLLADPTVGLIVVGYADKHGDETRNLEISKDRAESVVKALKQRMDMANVVHAVGMGGQDLFDQKDAKKNCVVEVWTAQP